MSFLSQLLAFLIPAAEKASPAIRNIANAVFTIEAGSPYTVQIPWLGSVVLQKPSPSTTQPAPASQAAPAPVAEPPASA